MAFPARRSPGLLGWLAVVVACGPAAAPDLAFERAVNALDEGRAERARIHFADALERRPDEAELWRLAGDSWMAGTLRSPTRAIEHWQRHLELAPENGEVAIRLVEALLLLGEWQQALEWSERLDDSPRAQAVRARIFLDSDLERAEQAIAAAQAADAGDARLAALAARVYDQAGKAERAREQAERALHLNPLDLQSTYLLARLLRRLGDPEGAVQQLETHQLLVRLTGAGSVPTPEAAEGLRILRELEPRVHAEALEFRLEKLRRLVENGHRDSARELLSELARDPELTSARRLELVGIADKLGDPGVAHELLDHVLAAAPADGRGAFGVAANQREALYGLAVLAHRNGDQARLEQLIDEGLERFPQAARFHHLHGRQELAGNRPEEAERSFERALDLAPWKSDCRIDLANLWLAAGRLEDIDALLAAAPEADPALEGYRRRHGLH